MADFNWQSFLTSHHIEFVERGPNVSRGHINIACPFCGDDPSHHMGLSLEGKGWGCWRNREHRGRSPIRLIQALIACSYQEARTIAGLAETRLDEFSEAIAMLKAPRKIARTVDNRLELPKEFRPIVPTGLGKQFYDYLVARKFERADISDLIARYDLRFCMSSPWAFRIIVPIVQQGRLVTWTGRTVRVGEEPRYKTLSPDREKAEAEGLPCAPSNIKRTLFNLDRLRYGGQTLYVTEGVFDAMKVDFYGHRAGVHSTCLFNMDASSEQLDLLMGLRPRFRRFVVLLDAGQIQQSLRLAQDLAPFNPEFGQLPKGVKDPGDLTKVQVNELK